MRRAVTVSLVGLLLAGGAGAADVFVYPQKGQSPEQQQQDEYACYQWAKAQTGVDPMQVGSAQPDRGQRARGAAGGAARGAALGAAVGEIAADEAGKGAGAGAVLGAARGRRGAVASEQTAEQARVDGYQRAFAACMDARGYSVK